MPCLSLFTPPPPLTCIFPEEGLRLSSYPISFVSLTSFGGLTKNVHLYLLVLKGVTCKIITDPGGGGGFQYKSDRDARRLSQGCNCRFWSHLGCMGLKVTIFAHSGIA